jgi:hypothetical protein
MEIETYIDQTGRKVIKKDPQATLDYTIDLADWLALSSDVLATVTWTMSAGITKTAQSNTTNLAIGWFSGGTVGAMEWATCHFTTSGGRIDDRTIYFQISNR